MATSKTEKQSTNTHTERKGVTGNYTVVGNSNPKQIDLISNLVRAEKSKRMRSPWKGEKSENENAQETSREERNVKRSGK